MEDGLTVQLSQNATSYRIDSGEWIDLSSNTATPSINSGQKISFKITNPTISTSYGIGTFTVNKAFDVEGNIMSLLYGDNFEGQIDLSGKDYVFCRLFNNCTTLKNAENLILPATTLAEYCYSYMFSSCRSLTTAPELPATTLAGYCYYYMFNSCTSLTTAPELPATTLTSYCYSYMFSSTNVLPDCSNIDFANETVVASGGLMGLFAGTKVTDADLERILPKNDEGKYCLPATTLTVGCYRTMFKECTSLITAPELPATTLAKNCYYEMFSNCTSLTTAPELPATTLIDSCYYYMFRYCKSLTTSPELPATTLATSCYFYMFQGCSKLNYIKMLATKISASNCLNNWVSGVASAGTFVKAASMRSLPSGTSGIPSGWTIVDYDGTN